MAHLAHVAHLAHAKPHAVEEPTLKWGQLLQEMYLRNQSIPLASRALFTPSVPDAIRTAINTQDLRYAVNNVSFTTAAEVSSQLAANTETAVGKGALKLTDFRNFAKIGISGLVGVGLPIALAILQGGAEQAEFDKINAKLDSLQKEVEKIDATVTRTSVAVDQLALDNAIDNMRLDELAAQASAYKQYITLARAAKGVMDPAVLQIYVNQFENNATVLSGIINSMENQFRGQGGRTSLMAAYAQVLKDTSPQDPYLTNSYSKTLAKIYGYWKNQEAIASSLLVNYYMALGYFTHATEFYASANDVAQNNAKDMLLDTSTLPKPIPNYGVYDPRTGYMWSRFDTAPMSQYIAKYNFAAFISGDANLSKYLYGDTPAGKVALDAGTKAFTQQKDNNLKLGIPKFFKWSLPSRAQLGTIAVPGAQNGTPASAIASYLTAKGFPAGVVPYQVWTSDEKTEHVIGDFFRGTPAHDVNYYLSTIAGNTADFGSWREQGQYPSNKMNTGIQGLYVIDLGKTYANARAYAYSDFPTYETATA